MRTIPNASDFRREDYRQIIRIESTHVSITESEVLEGSFTFDSSMVENSSFQIGTAIADEVNVTVADPNGELTTYIDDTYQIYISAIASGGDRSLATWTLLGEYVVAELDTSYSGRAKVKFQDRMVTLDVPLDFQTGTLYANLQSLGLTLSLTQEEITFLSGLSVLNRQTMTKRDFIRGCALLMWENAYLKADGSLAFRALTTTAQSFTPSDRFSSELGDAVTIGPVRVIDDSGAVIYTMGSASGQKIEISSTTSPMISLIGSIEGLATYYSTATIPGRGIADFSYIPLTMSLLSTWALEPGDVVSYIDKASNTYTSLITSVAHVLNGASACTSAGEAKVRQSQQIPVQTDETRAVIQQLETGIDTAQSTASEAMPKYGVCSTAASVATKEVDVGSGFVLRNGARVSVLMQYSNTSTSTLKLKVNSTAAKNIVNSEGNAIGFINGENTSWTANTLITFVYNGTNWVVEDNLALTRINNILTDNLVGTNGWINLKDGKFNYGSGKLVWNGSTLSVTGTIESTNGHIGNWTIGSNVLTSSGTYTVDNVDTPYSVFMQAPQNAVPGNAAFAVRHGVEGSYTYPFLVQYNGTLTATKANITGTVSASTITGSTISGSEMIGEEINIRATGNVENGTSTYKTYDTQVATASQTSSGMIYKGAAIWARIKNSSDTYTAISRVDVDALGVVRLTGQNGVEIRQSGSNTNLISATSSGTSIGNNLSVTGTITENGSRLNQKVTGMAANGSTKSSNSVTWTSFDDTYTLSANHRYLVTYNVEFASNATGHRLTRATIDGSTAGNIGSARQQAVNGNSTICGATFWIQASSSQRTLGFDEYQSSGGSLNGTLRYQVIDFGV